MIRIIGYFGSAPGDNGERIVVDTTSRAAQRWEKSLSPFYCGPVDLYKVFTARNVENAWQYTKVYPRHDDHGLPTDAYYTWAMAGWANPRAVRYPMGKGAVPSYSWWDGDALGYVEARKKIYCPLYATAVRKTEGYAMLESLVGQGADLVFRDFDGYDHVRLGLSLSDVLNDPVRKMGHSFVLAAMLTNDPSMDEWAV